MSAAGDLEAIREMFALSPEDWTKAQTITDPEVLRDLLLGARAFGARVDRSTIGQAGQYLSSISPQDWLSLLKSVLPILIPLL